MKMHEGELDIGAELVGRLVAAQFPRLAGLPIRAVQRRAAGGETDLAPNGTIRARGGADAVVRRGTGDQTDQESRSGGHGAATSLTVMDVTIHWSSSTPRGPVTCSDSSYRPCGQHAAANPYTEA